MAGICSICQEKLQSGRAIVLSLCGHVLCAACITQWAHRNNPPNKVDCPMCRKKHAYPKNTTKLYFEEERSEAEAFRSEIRALMKLVETCAEQPNGANLVGIVSELGNLLTNGKKLGEPNVTAATINSLDAMISHLSKKLGPVQSNEGTQAALREAQRDLEELLHENARLQEESDILQIRQQTMTVEMAATKGSLVGLRNEYNQLLREHAAMKDQLAQQRKKNVMLQQHLSACEESRDSAREKFVILKKKYKVISESNEALKIQVNRALAARRTPSPPNRGASPSASRVTRRPSIISIHSQSSPDAKYVSLVSSDNDENLASENSDVQLISDTESLNDPAPSFHELKPVKPPAALFQATPLASTSKPPSSRFIQKRKLAVQAQKTPSGLELRNGKLTGTVAIGPKRTRKC